MNADGAPGVDPAGPNEPLFGNEPIDRGSSAPQGADSIRPIVDDDDIPFDDPAADDDDDLRERWDADDERRQEDCFAPPKDPVECYCLHCQRTFMSDQMWFQRIIGRGKGELDGFWMCPTNNCSGAGFTFDIFPTDPTHPANSGWTYFDTDDDDEEYDPDLDEDLAELNPDDVGNTEQSSAEYDPTESKYKQLDAEMGDAEDDIAEGDEWKLGLAPGEEVPPQMYWSESARTEWEKEQADYDAPDRRPRELDWSKRDDGNGGGGDDGEPEFKEEDIPF
jgi:hypothetical protein